MRPSRSCTSRHLSIAATRLSRLVSGLGTGPSLDARKRLSIVKSFWTNLGKAQRIQRKGRGAMAATGHKPVVHTVGWRGRIKTAQVESEQATSQFVCWARAGQSGSRDAALSSSARMLLLCLLKGGNLITAVVQPHGKDDPGPHIRQSAYRHRVTFAFCPFSLVIGLGPRLTLRRLPSKLMQGVAQGLDTRQ